jgi:cellulose 1,4-beta-cellobiosidase
MMANESAYQQFQMLNREFTFDVDVSKAPCAVNGALYFTEMDPLGSMMEDNKAGAKYGTGYCDTQCIKGKWALGEAPINGTESACCTEMDIWEANNMANALTPHPCQKPGQQSCTGDGCNNQCDSSGCDFNPYHLGQRNFFGTNGAVDTTKPFTVITQFLTNDNTANGKLAAINRFYKQNGKIIPNARIDIPGISTGNATITNDFCKSQAQSFNEAASYKFEKMGALEAVGASLSRGMTLSLSIWDDSKTKMQWLDGVQSSSSGQ